MICTDVPPEDAAEWIELARCLDDRRLHEAAARAWQRAWQADPSQADLFLEAALAHAHRTGDDAFVVEIASTLDSVDSLDVRGHLALARGEYQAVPAEACRYPLARFLLAAQHHDADELKSEVMALRESASFGSELVEELDRGPRWQAWNLADASILRVASIYAGLRRFENAGRFASLVADQDGPLADHGRALDAWTAVERGEPERAHDLAEEAAATVPEASVVLVAVAADPLEAAAEARARWTAVREAVEQLTDLDGEPPREAITGALPLSMTRVGAASPMAPMWVRTYFIERERRRARKNPLVAGLVEEASEALDQAMRVELARAAERGLVRIDGALRGIDIVVETGQLPAFAGWTAADFGW